MKRKGEHCRQYSLSLLDTRLKLREELREILLHSTAAKSKLTKT